MLIKVKNQAIVLSIMLQPLSVMPAQKSLEFLLFSGIYYGKSRMACKNHIKFCARVSVFLITSGFGVPIAEVAKVTPRATKYNWQSVSEDIPFASSMQTSLKFS